MEKYLPTPFPLQRLRPEYGGGFMAQEPKELGQCHFRSYGEWYEAQQPLWKKRPPKPLHRVQSTAFWPLGRNVTQVTGSLNRSDAMSLDTRLIESTVPFVPSAFDRSSSAPHVGVRSRESAANDVHLEARLGSEAEVSLPRRPAKGNPMNGHNPYEHLQHLFPQEARQQELRRRAAACASRPSSQSSTRGAPECLKGRPESAPAGLFNTSGSLPVGSPGGLKATAQERPKTAAGRNNSSILGCTTVYRPLPPPGSRPEFKMPREEFSYRTR